MKELMKGYALRILKECQKEFPSKETLSTDAYAVNAVIDILYDDDITDEVINLAKKIMEGMVTTSFIVQMLPDLLAYIAIRRPEALN